MRKLSYVLVSLMLFSIDLLSMEERENSNTKFLSYGSTNKMQNSLAQIFANDNEIKPLLHQAAFVLAKKALGENFSKKKCNSNSCEIYSKNFVQGIENFIKNAIDGIIYPIEDANSFCNQIIKLKNFIDELKKKTGIDSNLIFDLIYASLNKMYKCPNLPEVQKIFPEMLYVTPLILAILNQPEAAVVILDIVDINWQNVLLKTELFGLTPPAICLFSQKELSRTNLFIKLFGMINQTDKRELLNKKICCEFADCRDPLIIFIKIMEDKILLTKVLELTDNQIKKELLSFKFGSSNMNLLMEVAELGNYDVLKIFLGSVDSNTLKELLKEKDYLGQNLLMYAANSSVETIYAILNVIDDQTRREIINEKDNFGRNALNILLLSIYFAECPKTQKDQLIELLSPKI